MSERQKTVLITGCSPGGIGHALALNFHNRGYHVVATARRTAVLGELREKGMTTLALDVTSAESIAECSEEVTKVTSGKLDILINNAGVGQLYPAIDLSPTLARQVFETNYFGAVAMIQTFMSQLMAARGLIINISSGSARVAFAFRATYSASKAALDSYSRTLRMEVAPLGVRVMTVVGGLITTNMTSPQDGTVRDGRRDHEPLPDDSPYKPAEDIIFAVPKEAARGCSPEEFAEQVATAATRTPGWWQGPNGSPDLLWAGAMSGLIRVLTTLGEGAADALSYRSLRIAEIAKRVNGGK